MKFLGYTEDRLKELDGYWTAKEIEQQPDSWLRTHKYLLENTDRINQFLEPILARKECRIILTGAGTSAFAGACVAPYLSRILDRSIEAIPTTDLVSGPEDHFRRDIPTLLISFARSGNSPESVATVELADALIDECHQLVVSCNATGNLYRHCESRTNCLGLLMPEETNDRAFAMTSSFSCMLLAVISVITGIEAFGEKVAGISAATRTLIETRNREIKQIADTNFSRVIYLGSNGMTGLAQEASLKLLELTDGQVFTMHDSSLGVRHGPKSILNEDTLVVVFMSSNSYTRMYDLDLLNELIDDRQVGKIIALSAATDVDASLAEYFTIKNAESFSDLELLFPFIVFAQIYGFHHALKVGNRPDNPSASGTVNRVVKGVKIHACSA